MKLKKISKNFLIILASYFLIILVTNPGFAKLITEKNVLVTHVIDGDTIWVEFKNKKQKIRLLGINAPEISTNPPEFFSYEASNALMKLIAKQTITIVYDNNYKFDKYKRILAHIYLDQPTINSTLWINEWLIANGYAMVYIINNTPIANLEKLKQAQYKAITSRIGVWQNKENLPITPKASMDYLNEYKIVEGTILSIYEAKKSIWLQMEKSKQYGFSIRIDKNILDDIKNHHNISDIKGKKIMISGFINQYSPNFGAFIDLKNPFSLDIIE